MADFNYVKQQFKRFEENITNIDGIEGLQNALTELSDDLEEAELIRAKNLVVNYRTFLIKKTKESLAKGTPDSKELGQFNRLMRCFVEVEFDDDEHFKKLFEEVQKILLDTIFIESFGGKFSNLSKEEKEEVMKILSNL